MLADFQIYISLPLMKKWLNAFLIHFSSRITFLLMRILRGNVEWISLNFPITSFMIRHVFFGNLSEQYFRSDFIVIVSESFL